MSKRCLLNILVLRVLHPPTEPALTSKSDSTLATRPATVPGYRLMPSEPPPAGSTGVVRNEPSPGPAQTTSEALERTPSPSPGQRWLCTLSERSALHLHGTQLPSQSQDNLTPALCRGRLALASVLCAPPCLRLARKESPSPRCDKAHCINLLGHESE